MRINDHEDRLQELEQEKTRIIEMKSAKEENVKVGLSACLMIAPHEKIM